MNWREGFVEMLFMPKGVPLSAEDGAALLGFLGCASRADPFLVACGGFSIR
jgi:hypothetical protein